MQAKIVAFSGISNSGKSTLIQKLITEVFCHQKILVIKHDPKNKAVFDTQGKDSEKFFNSGADVILSSPIKIAFFSHYPKEVKTILQENQNQYEYIFIEGYKDFVCPRICVIRKQWGEIIKQELEFAQAIATDDRDLRRIYQNYDILELDKTKEIGNWIIGNAKTLDEVLSMKRS